MGAAPINYDALAQQHGGTATVDYDSLAAQHGGSSVKPSTQTESTQAAPEGFWHSLGATFGVTPEAAQERIQNMKDHPIKAAIMALAGPAGTFAKGLYDQATQSGSEISQAAQAGKEGNTAGVAQHAITAIPIVGPAMNRATDQYAEGNYAGEMGTLTGAAAQAAPMVAGAADSALPANRPVIPNPTLAGTVGRAALLGKTPEGAYESALKPSTTLPASQRAAIVQTGLKNEIPISKAGLEKLGDQIDTLNQAIKDQIATDPNRPIDPNAVATRADSARAKFANQVNAGGDLAAIDASKQQFLNEQGATPGNPAPPMSAADAQAMKQGTYRVLSGKFGEQGSASVEAQKALARGLKEEIATQFPEISTLNANESRLLDLQPVLERAVNRISNHQGIGIGTPIAGAATTAITRSGGAGAVASVLKSVLDNPSVKSRLAIMVSKSQKVPIGTAISKVQAYSTSLAAIPAASQQSSNDDNPGQQATPQP